MDIELDSSYENQKIIDVEIDKEIKKSFLEYAMSVITARALPDVRDGFKPIHRRILYAMYEEGLTYSKPTRKSATTVGYVMGHYHPHGDLAIYDSLVRMAQPFSLRYPLIDGQGNFGNVDGDGAAAMRYTESRMSRLAEEMMADIEKNVVDMIPNFDNKLEEPVVLPSRFPNLLVNGSIGIAVVMATNIPPHNLGEVIDGIIATMDNPDMNVLELMQYIKGPDFPTYASIYGTSGIIEGYMTGRGRVLVRAKAEIEEYKKTHRIIVTEIPYQVNKSNLVESIADLVKDKRVDGITDIRDESGRAGMRIVIDLRRDVNPEIILNQLYKFTQMQDTFAMNMVALVKGEPKTLNLKQMIIYYINHQVDVVTKRIKFDLEKARQRAHIYEGLKIAIDNIDEVINIIRSKKTVGEARQALIERFEFSEAQGQAIVELPLGRLSGLEIEKIIEELARLNNLIQELTNILADQNAVNQIIKNDLLEIKRRYGDERRTEIIPNETEIFFEDLIEREECVVTMTEAGYIKRQPASVYQAQRRGGKGISAMATKEDDFVTDMFASNSHDIMLMFTNKGRAYAKKCYEIPVSSRISKGMNIVNLLELGEGETISTIIPLSERENGYLVMVTKRGVIKRSRLSEFSRVNRNGKIAVTLDEGDELAFVLKTNGNDEIFIAATNGLGIKFHESAVRVMGRTSRGVRGIRLKKDASVAGVTVNPGEIVGRDAFGAPLTEEETDLDLETETETETEIIDLEEYIEEDDETDDGDDEIVGDGVLDVPEGEEETIIVDENILTIITITKNGLGKRCEFERFTRRNRGGKGMACHKISEKTGELVGALSVLESDDIMIITDDGTMIRTPVSGIPVYNNRAAGGVKVMKTSEGVSIKSVIRVAAADDEEIEDIDGDIENGEEYVGDGVLDVPPVMEENINE
ncbi:MAG: DNA gyrase subunit A [Oscillospiraceae bacterium]|nr:DNA gyrase subunit A [Oscillospiraceae bacterium]